MYLKRSNHIGIFNPYFKTEYDMILLFPCNCSAWPKLKTKIGLHPPHRTTQTFWHVPGILGDWNMVYSIRITQINNFLRKKGGANTHLVRNNSNQSCYKLPEMARNLVKNDFWDTPRKKKAREMLVRNIKIILSKLLVSL